jgi:Ca-activated chloride channel homolog
LEETAVNFAAPKLLWLLLLVPTVVALIWWSFRARQRAMAQFVGTRLIETLTVGLSRTRQKLRAAMLVVAIACALFAMARPRWGYGLEETKQSGLDVVVALDTSKSMLAEDVRPNRLARAKLAALDLMRLSKSDRLGVVAFAGSAFLQCPLSLDEEAFRQSIESLDVNIIPQGGTAVAEAIQTALSAFKEKTDNHKILVLFTDGEDNEGDAGVLEAARASAKDGLRIFTIGVGTPPGEVLSTSDPFGNRVFLKDSAGNVVKSRLNETLLQQIAKETGGFYLPLSGATTMDVLYERGLAPLPKSDFSAKTVRQWHERFQWFLGAALVLLLAEMIFPERSNSRRARATVAAALVMFAAASSASASVTDAQKNFERGKYDKARAEFEQLAKKHPDDARLRFNAGAAAFNDQDYESALRHFSGGLSAPDVQLQQRSYYNLGNTQFRVGERAKDPKEKQQAWEQAIRDYENALKLDGKDADAQFNRDVVKQKLEELKNQQQQQQQQNKDQQNKDDPQKNDDQKQQQEKQDQQNKEQKDQQSGEKKDEQSKKDQQQQQQGEKKDQEDPSAQQQQAQDQRGEQPDKASQAAQYGRVMQMTPQQAMQLLEAQKSDEKAMIFVPQNVRTNKPQNRVFKDW